MYIFRAFIHLLVPSLSLPLPISLALIYFTSYAILVNSTGALVFHYLHIKACWMVSHNIIIDLVCVCVCAPCLGGVLWRKEWIVSLIVVVVDDTWWFVCIYAYRSTTTTRKIATTRERRMKRYEIPVKILHTPLTYKWMNVWMNGEISGIKSERWEEISTKYAMGLGETKYMHMCASYIIDYYFMIFIRDQYNASRTSKRKTSP